MTEGLEHRMDGPGSAPRPRAARRASAALRRPHPRWAGWLEETGVSASRRRPEPSRALASALLVASSIWAAPARAFECTDVPPCDAGSPDCPDVGPLSQAWNQRCVPVWIRRGDPLFSGDEGEAIVLASFARWTTDLACTDFEVLFMGYTDAAAGFDVDRPGDQENVVHATRDAEETAAYFDDPDLLAITLTTFSTRTGEILDADIVFNTGANAFGVVGGDAVCRPRTGFFDVENTLVHEAGHFFGFDHVDLADATMFAAASRCETSKRDLAMDDIDAMCTVYAAGAPTRTCDPPPTYEVGDVDAFRDQCERAMDSGCSCQTPGRGPRGGLALVAALLAAQLVRQRRGMTA